MEYRAIRARRNLAALTAGAAIFALAGCGGGGGVNSTPTPAPTPSPTPTVTPTPSPTSTNFITAEYQTSDGPAFHNTLTAWQSGATGKNVTLAIVDTGIDANNTEFAGRISVASADVAGNRTYQAQDDHGTQVALVAAAARNNSGIMGIAFEATIQALRADAPGTCASTIGPNPGCNFLDVDIADGVNRAVSAGARVINLSLGGDAPNNTLLTAITQAAAAGVVVVVSAGNEGASTDPNVANNPDPFAAGVRNAGGANVIIAGSVDSSSAFSTFSNRAGNQATYFLSALGEGVCCVYNGSVIDETTGTNGARYVTLVNGTSFAAPQITGAVALLAQAFPNLTGAQIVSLLLSTARKPTGFQATGTTDPALSTDLRYGRGILDIARAFQPQGTSSLAGTSIVLPLADIAGTTGPAMGDAAQGAQLGAVILDGYSRAYQVDLAHGLRKAAVEQRLAGALLGRSRNVALDIGKASLAFSIDGRTGASQWAEPLRLSRQDAEQARVLAATVTMQVAPGKSLGFSYRQSAHGLAAQLQGRRQPAFLIATAPGGDIVRTGTDTFAFGYRHMLGQTGLTVIGERGAALTDAERFADPALRPQTPDRMTRLGVAFDRQFGALTTVAGLSLLREDRTVLGARFHDALGGGGSSSLFADLRADWSFAQGWLLGLAGRVGQTHADGSTLISPGSSMISSAWAVDLERQGVFAGNDAVALRVSQPLRVESGGLSLHLPVAYDYSSQSATFGYRDLSLAPKGRELMAELAWRGQVLDGSLAASIFWRKDPGHYAALPDDKGIALRWQTGF